MTTMNVVPQLLDIFWNAMMREVENSGRAKTFERMRRISRHLPYWARRLVFRKLHQRLGGSLRMFASGAAYLPPTVQQAWQDLGIVVIQAYGTTECGLAAVTSYRDHPVGRVGRAMPPASVELAADGEILVSGPTVSAGYWGDPSEVKPLRDEHGRYHTGDIGRLEKDGNLTLLGRKKNIIVLANGLKVYPEDIENALRVSGLGDSVVLEATPGGSRPWCSTRGAPPRRRARNPFRSPCRRTTSRSSGSASRRQCVPPMPRSPSMSASTPGGSGRSRTSRAPTR